MCLLVNANGYGESKGTHFSVLPACCVERMTIALRGRLVEKLKLNCSISQMMPIIMQNTYTSLMMAGIHREFVHILQVQDMDFMDSTPTQALCTMLPGIVNTLKMIVCISE